MEQEIMALTKGSMGGAATKVVSDGQMDGGIKVLKYGQANTSDGAGINHGSAWCPPQCSRRTVMGGFFTS